MQLNGVFFCAAGGAIGLGLMLLVYTGWSLLCLETTPSTISKYGTKVLVAALAELITSTLLVPRAFSCDSWFHCRLYLSTHLYIHISPNSHGSKDGRCGPTGSAAVLLLDPVDSCSRIPCAARQQGLLCKSAADVLVSTPCTRPRIGSIREERTPQRALYVMYAGGTHLLSMRCRNHMSGNGGTPGAMPGALQSHSLPKEIMADLSGGHLPPSLLHAWSRHSWCTGGQQQGCFPGRFLNKPLVSHLQLRPSKEQLRIFCALEVHCNW